MTSKKDLYDARYDAFRTENFPKKIEICFLCFFTYYASPINLSLLQIMGLLQNISPSNIPGFSGTWQQDLIVDQTETLNSQTFLNNGYNGNIE